MNYIPALRGHMGDSEYYITVMKLADVARQVRFADELHPHKGLDEMIQRELGKRTSDMVTYLLNQPQRFYGALIVAVYGGNPKFELVRMAEHRMLDGVGEAFGVITFDGSQQYFALDGQHRLKSIKDAVEQKPSLGSEEIGVIFVAHHGTQEGLERTRRLFTTLNRYAVKTETHTEIALDEDDGIAIITRRLIREHPFFDGDRIKLKGKSIGRNQDAAFTTLATLYEINQNLLMEKDQDVKSKKFQQFRPDDDMLDRLYQDVEVIWDGLISNISGFRAISERRATPGSLRKGGGDEGNGLLTVRPLGQLAFSRALRVGLNNGVTLDDCVKKLDRVDWKLNASPWRGTVWLAGKMVTTKEMQRLCFRLICYMAGFLKKNDLNDLRYAYRTQLEDPKAALPPSVV